MESLNTTKLRAILNELEGVPNWHALGIRLGVPPSELDVIEQNHPKNAGRCKTEMTRRWLNNAATPSWKNLVLALNEIGEQGAAGKIEEKYLKRLVMLRMDSSRLQEVSALILSVLAVANSPDVNEASSAAQLSKINIRLCSGKIQAGIVGLVNSGKSTTLNAILGASFLPFSFQAQTAVEAHIVHDPSSHDGVLSGMIASSGTATTIARGRRSIYDSLLAFNQQVRNGQGSCKYSQLILSAPLPFLRDVQHVALEISDTAGTNEAGKQHITATSMLALKNLCAFVVVLNCQFMEMDSGSKLLQKLKAQHPDLLTKLNRILFLANAYDICYNEGSKGSLKPEEIPAHVSKHFRDPNVLGATIPLEHIIPFSAKWALRAREWNANPKLLLDDKDGKNKYREALILLSRAEYEKEVQPLDAMNEANIRAVCSYLERFSHIEEIEQKLKEMLYSYGPGILQESATDDTLHEIEILKQAIAKKILCEEVGQKQATVTKHQGLVNVVRRVTNAHLQKLAGAVPASIANSVATQLQATTAALENTVNSRINSTLVGNLSNMFDHENRGEVHSRICGVKPQIISPSSNEMQKSWATATQLLRNAQTEQLKLFLSQFKSELISTLSAEAGANTQVVNAATLAALISRASQQASEGLGALNVASAVLPAPPLQLSLSCNSCDAVSDANLGTHITVGTKTKYRQETHKHKVGGRRYGVVGPKKHKHITVSVPYQVSVYSPNIPALHSTYSALTSFWVGQFRVRLNEIVSQSSQRVSQSTTALIQSALSRLNQELQNTLDSSTRALKSSKTRVASLEACLKNLEETKKQLK